MTEWPSTDPNTLPSDAENYDVWCERCQKVHKHFTMTREDYDRIIRQGAKNMADEIDRRAVEAVMEKFRI